MPVPVNPPSPVCTAHGANVESVFVRLKPSPIGPAHIVSEDGGTWEFTRADFRNGHFEFGQGNDKLGPIRVIRMIYDETGLTIFGHDGRQVDVPRDLIQSATYKFRG